MSNTILTDEQQRLVDEILRVAAFLGKNQLSQREFDKHHQIAGLTTIGNHFGSWNEAVEAAGLIPYQSGGQTGDFKYDERELLQEILRLHKELDCEPSERKMNAFGKFSVKPYKDRWGSLKNAKELAYKLYGVPKNDS